MTETGKIRTFPLPQPAEDKPVRKTKSNKVSPSTPELAEEELAAKFATMNQEDYRDLAESPGKLLYCSLSKWTWELKAGI